MCRSIHKPKRNPITGNWSAALCAVLSVTGTVWLSILATTPADDEAGAILPLNWTVIVFQASKRSPQSSVAPCNWSCRPLWPLMMSGGMGDREYGYRGDGGDFGPASGTDHGGQYLRLHFETEYLVSSRHTHSLRWISIQVLVFARIHKNFSWSLGAGGDDKGDDGGGDGGGCGGD